MIKLVDLYTQAKKINFELGYEYLSGTTDYKLFVSQSLETLSFIRTKVVGYLDGIYPITKNDFDRNVYKLSSHKT